MRQHLASKAAMQSALDQWTAVDQLSDLAKRVLTPEEVERVEAPLRKSAEECLHLLDTSEDPDTEYCGDDSAISDDADISEILSLRRKLKKIAAGT